MLEVGRAYPLVFPPHPCFAISPARASFRFLETLRVRQAHFGVPADTPRPNPASASTETSRDGPTGRDAKSRGTQCLARSSVTAR
jgi:hypothetical protein